MPADALLGSLTRSQINEQIAAKYAGGPSAEWWQTAQLCFILWEILRAVRAGNPHAPAEVDAMEITDFLPGSKKKKKGKWGPEEFAAFEQSLKGL